MVEKPLFFCPKCNKRVEEILETYSDYQLRKVWSKLYEEYEIEAIYGDNPDTITCFECKTKVVELEE